MSAGPWPTVLLLCAGTALVAAGLLSIARRGLLRRGVGWPAVRAGLPVPLGGALAGLLVLALGTTVAPGGGGPAPGTAAPGPTPGPPASSGPAGPTGAPTASPTTAPSATSSRLRPAPGTTSAAPSRATPARSSTPARKASVRATLTSPENGARISSSGGLVASGRVTNLGRHTIWLLDRVNGYTVSDFATVKGSTWSAEDAPIGDQSDPLPFSVTVVAVLADPSCDAVLRPLRDAADNTLRSLPRGCSVFGRVEVEVVRR